MKHRLFFLLALLVFHPLSGQAKDTAEWKGSLRGRSTDDTLSSSKSVALIGLTKLHHDFSDVFSAQARGGFLLETGSSSALFTDEFRPESKFLLEEAVFDWAPADFFRIEAGAVDQSHHESPLLVDGGAFPAAREALTLSSGLFSIEADAQQAIPTGQNLTSKSTGKEPTPTLLTEKLRLKYGDEDFSVKLRSSLFRFDKLTHGIAQDSRFYGNTVTGIASASSFYYAYQGFEAGGEIRGTLEGGIESAVGGSYVKNTKGPAGHDSGSYGYFEVKYKGESFQLAPRFEYYKNETDSSPAFYSSKAFGHNNRKGEGVSLSLDFPQSKLNFLVRFFRSRLIENSAFQRDRFTYIELSVGTPYEGF